MPSEFISLFPVILFLVLSFLVVQMDYEYSLSFYFTYNLRSILYRYDSYSLLQTVSKSEYGKINQALLKAGPGMNPKVWIVSSGGVGTTKFMSYLDDIRTNVKVWRNSGAVISSYSAKHLWREMPIHFPFPLQLPFPLQSAIYIFGDPLMAICSLKRRKFEMKQILRLTHNDTILYSDSKLLQAIYSQFKAWTNSTDMNYPILRMRYEDLFDTICLKQVIRSINLSVVKFAPRQFKERNSQLIPCLNSLHIEQDLLHIPIEMNSFQSDCGKANQNVTYDIHFLKKYIKNK